MKRIAQLLLVVFALTGAAWMNVASAVEIGSKAMCLVCQVTHGEGEPETVKAVRTHEGKTYGFCSEKCAQAFAADPIAYLPPSLPRPAPAFAVKDLSGKALSNKSLAGKVVLLDFWATWCAPCRKSMPELQALHKKYAERGLSVIGISIDEDGPAKVKKAVKSMGITYPVAMDSEKSPAWEAYRVKSVPAAFLIDREGRVVAQWTGRAATGAEVEKELERLLATR